MDEVHLGDVVKDTITKFEGVALAKIVSLHEATQFRVHPQSCKDDGEMQPGVWIEATRLQVLRVAVGKIGFVPRVGE